MRRSLAAVLVFVLALAACGGGNDKDEAKDTVKQFFTALEEKDAGKLCDDLLSKEFIKGVTGATGDRGGKECRAQFTRLQATNIKLRKIDKVTVNGDNATVRATIVRQGQAQPQVLRLKKEDGDWRLVAPGTG